MEKEDLKWAGFTLLELMVVVVIIGIVTSFVTPALLNVVNSVALKSDVQTAQTIQNIVDMYTLNGGVVTSLDNTTYQNFIKAGYLDEKDLDEKDVISLRLEGNSLSYSSDKGVQLTVGQNYEDLVEGLDSVQKQWVTNAQ
ncbi:MAG: hypothetical protein ATN35_04940 [Epulopiscium sp. Nele67-Bin004]|nr:MAG: hypothetical protein ATN35_04940 [Epulopiscium sp. Nele67-Bin004]